MPRRALTYGVSWTLALGLCANPVSAARTNDPDWPCQQVKVEQLSVAAFWTQSSAAMDIDWQQDPAVLSLVGELIQRRLPIETAVERIDGFAVAMGSQKASKLEALFAGIFEVLNRERSHVLSGLDRYGQRQKILAATLRAAAGRLRDAQNRAPQDEKEVEGLSQTIMWDQQVFEARRQSVRFACNIPAEIEQRIFQLAKAIEQRMQ